MCRTLFASAFVAVTMLSAVSCGPVPDPIFDPRNGYAHVGMWSGTGVQTGGQTWQITANITSVQPGLCAQVEYPTVPCTGYWTCMPGFDGRTLRAYESVTSGNCLPGNVELVSSSTGALELRATVQGIEARAILQRVR